MRRYLFVWIAVLLGLPSGGGLLAEAQPASIAPTPANPNRGGVGLSAAGSAPSGLQSPRPDDPCFLLIQATKADLLEPARLDDLLAQAQERGLRVIIRILDDEWLSVADWSARITAFAQAIGGRAAAYQLLGESATSTTARDYAFMLKNARVAVRAAGSQALILGAPLGDGDIGWAEELFAADAAPYLDVVVARDLIALEAVSALRDRRHARVPVWVTDATIDAASPLASAAASYLEALSAGAELVLFGAPASPEQEEGARPVLSLGESLSALRAIVTPALRPATAGALPFDPARARTAEETTLRSGMLIALPFYDPERRDGFVAFRRAATDPTAPAALRIALRAPVESLDLVVPETGVSRRIAGETAAGAIVELPLRDTYLLLRYRLAVSALPLKERAQVGAISELTAEEIIARNREVKGIQEARLRHYEAKATVSIHYRLASLNESVDLITENRLFVKDGKQDYEQTALYVNGAIWRGKTPPYLPYIQPGKVGEVPLDIALDERYLYRLEGRQKVDDRDCYVLSFEPGDSAESLYHGKVFIDSKIFTRVRMEAVQTGLADPVRSNEVVYQYGPVPAPWGDAWLPLSMTGQMTFEVLGYNLVVERRAAYTDYQTNVEGFETRRDEAYESGRPLFRETDSGLFRLDAKGGQEELRSLDTPRNTLLVFGASVGESGGLSFPFAGVNFFDFNFHNTGTQFNLAWAGPFADLSWTQPNLFNTPRGRRPIALTLEGAFSAIETEEKNKTGEDIPDGHKLDVLRETMRAGLAFPMGSFFKTTLDALGTYQNYSDSNQNSDVSFVLPSTNVEGSLVLGVEYARLGLLATAWGEAGRRSRWARWGEDDQSYSPDDTTFTRLGASLRKAFYIGPFSKVSLGVSGYEGRSLDRFSRFELGDFSSARVHGFNGSGIHFDRGLIAEGFYAFPFGKSVRMNLGFEQGFVNSDDDFGPGYESVTGTDLNVEFSGPWSTFVTVRMGYGLKSTIDDTAGGGDLRVVFFRTFDKWSKHGSPGTPLSAPPPSPGDARRHGPEEPSPNAPMAEPPSAPVTPPPPAEEPPAPKDPGEPKDPGSSVCYSEPNR